MERLRRGRFCDSGRKARQLRSAEFDRECFQFTPIKRGRSAAPAVARSLVAFLKRPRDEPENHHFLRRASVGARIEIGSVPSKMGMSAASTLPAMAHAVPERNEISIAKLKLMENAAADVRATSSG